jgi:hypothetical protein
MLSMIMYVRRGHGIETAMGHSAMVEKERDVSGVTGFTAMLLSRPSENACSCVPAASSFLST